jgi:hypothetical protein
MSELHAPQKYIFTYGTVVRIVAPQTSWKLKYAIRYPSGNIGLGPHGTGWDTSFQVIDFAKNEDIPVIWEGAL